MIGKPAQCSKCQRQFVVSAAVNAPAAPAPVAAPDPFGGLGAADPFSGGGAPFGAAAAPDPFAAAAGIPSSAGFPTAGYAAAPYQAPAARRSSGNSKKLLLWLGIGAGGLVGVTVLAVAGWFLMSSFRGYATPEEAYTAFREAASTKNSGKMYDIMSPESQDMLVSVFAIMVATNPGQDAEVSTIATAYGITAERLANAGANTQAGPLAFLGMSPDKARAIAESVGSRRAFFVEVLQFAEKKRQQSNASGGTFGRNPLGSDSLGELTNLSVTGEKATGMVNGRPFNFRQINGGWRVHITI